MSTKAIHISILVLAGLLVCFFALIALTEKSDGAQEIQNYLSLNVANDDILHYEDSHGGFLGDGETVIVFTADESNVDFIRNNWSSEFADEQARDILFGSNGVLQSRGYSLPENGLFYFESSGSDYSVNFVFAVYNPTSQTVYYCRFDT